jgi:hypothetical protein
LTLRRHPLALLRERLAHRGITATQDLWEQPNGKRSARPASSSRVSGRAAPAE